MSIVTDRTLRAALAGVKENLDSMLPTGPAVLQRGIISLGAKPGVVYRNLGYIRVPIDWQVSEPVNQRIELTGLVAPECWDGVYITPGLERYGVNVTFDATKSFIQVSLPALSPIVGGVTSVRLQLTSETGKHPYIMKCKDGVIRPVSLPVPVYPTFPEAPDLKLGTYKPTNGLNVRDFVHQLLRLNMGIQYGTPKRWEIQMKVSKTQPIVFGKKFNRRKWRTLTSDMATDSRLNRLRRGVFRVRYKTRRHTSPWAVYSFYIDETGGFCHPHLVRLA